MHKFQWAIKMDRLVSMGTLSPCNSSTHGGTRNNDEAADVIRLVATVQNGTQNNLQLPLVVRKVAQNGRMLIFRCRPRDRE